MHIDDIIAKSRPAVRTVKVPVRGDLLERADELEDQLQRELVKDRTENRKPQAHDVARQIEALREEAEAETVTFRFQAIGHKAWSDLIRAHPASKKQRDEFGRDLEYNPETFPTAAIAASCIDPDGVDEAKVAELLEAWNFSQFQKLWGACIAVNVGDTSVPFSAVGSALLGLSEQRPTTQSPEASLDGGFLESPDGP
jgi:hypothetical protein